jgi:type VI protein secretion system component VasF
VSAREWLCTAGLALAVACLSAASVATASGCAALQYVLPIVTDIIADAIAAGGTLDRASSLVDAMLSRPSDAQLRERAVAAIERCRAALKVALSAAKGGRAATDEDYDAAFAEFRAAWRDLEDAIGPLGLVRMPGDLGGGTSAVESPDAAMTRAEQRAR